MNYDRKRVGELAAELAALGERERIIIAELQVALGGTISTDAPGEVHSGETTGKAAVAKPKASKGELQAIVVKALSGYTTAKTLKEIVAKVAKQRPGVRAAAVAAVLAALAKKGKVTKPAADTFYLPVVDAAPVASEKTEPVAPVQTEQRQKAVEELETLES